MRKLIKLILVLFALVFLGLQFIPSTTTPKPSATSAGPHVAGVVNPRVGAIFDRSCVDCHSNNTAWPWYSHVAPVSWIVSKHVSEAREALDFSEWGSQPDPIERLMICNAVSSGKMPLPEYTLIHRKAKLSKKDVATICGWAAVPSGSLTSLPVGKSTTQKE